MEKVKSFFRNLSLRKSFVLYVGIALFAAYLASGFTSTYFSQRAYLFQASSYFANPENDDRSFEEKYALDLSGVLPEDRLKIKMLNALSFWCVPFYFGVAVVIAALLFYRNKLKKPLALLEEASGRIFGE